MNISRLVRLAFFAAGLVACGDDGTAGDADTAKVMQYGGPADAAQADADACYDPCIAKGGNHEACDGFCGADSKQSGAESKEPKDSDEGFPDLPQDGSPGTYTVSFEHDGKTREAVVYVPASYSSDDAAPLLLNFHGFGGTAQAHMAEADMRPLADEHAFLLAYPQGSLLDGAPHWNSAAPSLDNKSDADDFGFVEELLDAVASSYSLDNNRVYAVGYSNGGMMSFGLSCYLSERIAAIGAVSGAMLDDVGVQCAPSHPTSVITLHGTNDTVLPYEGGDGVRAAEEVLNYWTGFNEIVQEPTEASTNDGGTRVDSFVYQGGKAGTEVHHYRVVNGDHVWFDLSVNGADTNRLIWDFLSRFGRDGAL